MLLNMKRIYTKRAMKFTAFRAKVSDIELLRLAAMRTEESQSAFLRAALRERAVRVLSGNRDARDENEDH